MLNVSSLTTDIVNNLFRICPGLNLADAALYILAATVLSAFDVLPALDTNGKPEVVEAKFSTKLISCVLDFA